MIFSLPKILNILKKFCSLKVPKDNFKCTIVNERGEDDDGKPTRKRLTTVRIFWFYCFLEGRRIAEIEAEKEIKIFKNRVSKPACLHNILTLGFKSAHFTPAKNLARHPPENLLTASENPFLLWSQINPF